MKTLKFVLRKIFKFIFLFWVVISSLLGSYIIADNFFGRTFVAWTLIRDFSSASLDLKDFSISASLRATAIGGRSWRDEREPKPDFSDDNSTGAPYELNIKFDHVSAPGIVLKNIKLEQVQSGRVVFEKDELEVPIEMGYSGYKSGGLEIPDLDSAHVEHKLSAEICVPDGTCTKFVHYFLPYRHVEGTAALRGIF
ncbi:hypothetical protein [uncultured Campylobacter sp.]|uniref:hypothetical protein n=1 Tax=uncultured Campylobacter sp. TaxID=218934 RepID=UPI0026036CC8|nr:hypothetical protein [uncultured Campylobacter sp.]